MPNSNCGRNAWSNMVKGLERWRLGASRPRSMPDQLWGTAGLSQGCAVRQSGGHTEAYGEAASPALTNRFGNNRAQSRPVPWAPPAPPRPWRLGSKDRSGRTSNMKPVWQFS